MNSRSPRLPSRPTSAAGMTLLEMMIGLGIGSVLVALSTSLWLFSSRSFAAMGNYTDLDNKSRSAADLISRDVREAIAVTAFQNNGHTKSLTLALTNAAQATAGTVTYTWNDTPRTLVCQKSGEADRVYLTECDAWDFQLYQRSPQRDGSYAFFPATNTAGAIDLSICKLINMTWKCSRTILGKKMNTESVQTAQVVLRNKQ